MKVNSGEPIGIPPAQRTEFDQALAAHQALTNFLDGTPSPGDACDEDIVLSDVSEHYEIERELGRGGMGVV